MIGRTECRHNALIEFPMNCAAAIDLLFSRNGIVYHSVCLHFAFFRMPIFWMARSETEHSEHSIQYYFFSSSGTLHRHVFSGNCPPIRNPFAERVICFIVVDLYLRILLELKHQYVRSGRWKRAHVATATTMQNVNFDCLFWRDRMSQWQCASEIARNWVTFPFLNGRFIDVATEAPSRRKESKNGKKLGSFCACRFENWRNRRPLPCVLCYYVLRGALEAFGFGCCDFNLHSICHLLQQRQQQWQRFNLHTCVLA